MKSLQSLVSSKPHSSSPSNILQPALPILRHDYSRSNTYVVPRVTYKNADETTRLDRALRQCKRAVFVGPPGSGKTCALRLIADGARVISLSGMPPGAIPASFGDAPILFDDAQPIHAEHLVRLARECANPIMVTAEEGVGSTDDFSVLQLCPLNDREIGSVVQAWFPGKSPSGKGGHQVINREAEAVVSAVKANPRSRLLAANPLNLFLLLQVYVKGEPLPAYRAFLFDAYVQTSLQDYFKTSSRSGTSAEGDPEFAARALEGIALALKRGELAKPEHLARGYGMLTTLPSGRIEFVHPLLRDMLAARALRRNPELTPVLEHALDQEWHHVLLFYAGLGDPRGLVEALLDDDQLELAALALAESAGPFEDLEKRIAEPLIRRAWEGQAPSAVSALSALRSNGAADFFAARLKERDPAARMRAASILGTLNTDRAVEYLLPQLRDTNAEVREQVVDALGRSTSDRVVEPLLVALRGDTRVGAVDTRMRVAAARALGEVGTERAVPALIVDLQVGEPEVRKEAVSALLKIGSGLALKPLQAIALSNQSAEVRAAADQVLSNL